MKGIVRQLIGESKDANRNLGLGIEETVTEEGRLDLVTFLVIEANPVAYIGFADDVSDAFAVNGGCEVGLLRITEANRPLPGGQIGWRMFVVASGACTPPGLGRCGRFWNCDAVDSRALWIQLK